MTRWLIALAACILAAAPRAFADDNDPIDAAAQAYLAFRADVAAFAEAPLSTEEDVLGVSTRIARHNREGLASGWLAYGAMVAAQTPSFAAGVRAASARYGRTAVLRALSRNPTYASRRRGYDDATARIADAAMFDQRAAADAATRLDAAAQRTDWPRLNDPEAMSRRLRALGAARFTPRDDTRALIVQVEAPPHTAAARLTPDGARVAQRMAALAAMRILDARGDWRAHMRRMLENGAASACVELAQLQYYQCVSVAHDSGEAAACAARHALLGVNACFAAAARP